MSAGTLYVVATPLGNLGDLSDRAKDVLRSVAVVAAEDTRRARTLVSHVGARPRLMSHHAHSPPARTRAVVSELEAGHDVALLTDAGTPTVSDPGAVLVARARAAGARIVAIPGPTAVAAALSISGFAADRYLFLGFPPRRGRDRREWLDQAAESPWTIVAYESPERLVALLTDLAERCAAERAAAVARELTKLHEECKTGTLLDLAGYYTQEPPRGEVTVVVAGRPAGSTPPADPARMHERMQTLLAEGLSRRDVADRLAVEFKIARRDAYDVVHGGRG